MDLPDQVAVGGGVIGVVWVSQDEVHTSGGTGGS